MNNKIFVTGATGTIGYEVVQQLQKKQFPIRVGLRNPKKAQQFKELDIEIVAFDYENPDTFANALRDIDKIFLMTLQLPAPMIKQFIDAARTAEVKHIVHLSILGADSLTSKLVTAERQHDIEKYIQSSSVGYTFIRPSSFMQNFLRHYAPQGDKIYLPFGDGRVGYIDGRDVATVSVTALTTLENTNKVYEITGPESLSVYQIADILSKVSGKKVTYIDVPEAAARQTFIDAGYTEQMIDIIMQLFALYKSNQAAVTTSVFEEVTGQQAATFETFANDHAHKFIHLTTQP